MYSCIVTLALLLFFFFDKPFIDNILEGGIKKFTWWQFESLEEKLKNDGHGSQRGKLSCLILPLRLVETKNWRSYSLQMKRTTGSFEQL